MAQRGRKKWRGKALLWAVAGMAGYFALVDFCWLLVSSGSLTLALESALASVALVLLFGWPAWLVVWAVALVCGALVLTRVHPRRYVLRRRCFMAAIASGCGACVYAPLALIYGTEAVLSPFSPLCLALVTFAVGLFAARSYYPGRPRPAEQG
ncbi:hypothetical protein Srot_1554 [Segniliparus rotundus DSM 44985]|uniref:Uncharacterized protein n=1 Tax=Segniliparus rotundus (strain ATCC BAA-972 / CDC 1076 / CIP 108378 / DSM 44985 / JCM 13578) TaxID=640132 RepID=D6Z7T7_SEGRD|nr:hypothetical protein [Segniliparus rotundus]ADG98017.1 hypothetical protein Srot_1554 [Segniliparus rotundus DSM 44985]